MKRTEQAIRDYIVENEDRLKQRVVNIFIAEIANSVFFADLQNVTMPTWSHKVRDDIEDLVKEILDFDDDPTVSA
tara:strand:+ start:1361 stop:1585 length:225 start_codon:yes stop_codon:yes gene_type:complete